MYIWLSFLGLSYAWSLYDVFDINIFDFVEPVDFLLFALSETALLTISFAALGLIFVYPFLAARAFESVGRVLNFVYEFAEHHAQAILAFLIALYLLHLAYSDKDVSAFGIVDIIVVPVILIVVFIFSFWLAAKVCKFIFRPSLLCLLMFLVFTVPGPLLLGSWRAQAMLGQHQGALISTIMSLPRQMKEWTVGDRNSSNDGRQHVRVTLRQDATQPATRLPMPEQTFLIGTTSSFHFFYECEKALKVEPKCSNGRPFIVPTANIASLEFNPPPVNTRSVPPVAGRTCQTEKFYTIQSFPEGRHDKLENDGQGKLAALLNDIGEKFEESTLQQLVLIGRVDVSPLREKREYYGTQMDLAKARAEWVQGELLKKFPTRIDPDRTMLLSAGPQYVGNDDDKRAKDRSVEVYTCWAPKPEQEAASVKPAR